MPLVTIPIDLDLRALPPLAAQIEIPMDLPVLIAHTGALDGNAYPLHARTEEGAALRAQVVSGGLLVELPEAIAGRDRVGISLVVGVQQAEARAGAVVFSQGPDSVEISIGGKPFAVYRYNTAGPDLPRPYFHPIIGPTGVAITQDGEIPGTRQGHFHHTGLVLAHQNFTDGNNWQIGPNFSRMRHVAFDVMQSGPLAGRFIQRLEWPSARGDRVVFRESRTVTIPSRPIAGRLIDVDTVITCGDQPAVWNATPYHLLAIRVPDAMVVDRGGVITNSEGQTNKETAGKPARWLDFSGSLDGPCGVAIFDHPENPRHPTPWLNFENETVGAAPTHREPLAWEAGQNRRFRFRVYFHEGDVRQSRVAGEYAAFAAAVKARIGAPVRV